MLVTILRFQLSAFPCFLKDIFIQKWLLLNTGKLHEPGICYLHKQGYERLYIEMLDLGAWNYYWNEKVIQLKISEIRYRSSRPEVFCKKCVENVAKFTGKHLCQRLFFNKIAGLGPVNLLK